MPMLTAISALLALLEGIRNEGMPLITQTLAFYVSLDRILIYVTLQIPPLLVIITKVGISVPHFGSTTLRVPFQSIYLISDA